MPEWSALERRKASLRRARDFGDGGGHEWSTDVQFAPGPEPGTGKILIGKHLPTWAEGMSYLDLKQIPDYFLRPVWFAEWYSDDGPEMATCPVNHQRGVYEWAARQHAARVLESVQGAVGEGGPIEPPEAVNRAPDPGCGVLEIRFDQGKPQWQGVWYDLYAGLAIFTSDDLREVVDWAVKQPAEARLFFDVGRNEGVDLETFRADPGRYIYEYD
ncbi:hypothetical protein SAMN05421678_102386 [Actinopolymorpha cephalotaxi]|uniref:Uncharacterized protein n=1 Tax=Actinopolymorpha cephalotaxi TaxID=504797 RepID=A0A1I2M018_9ACTN|nr:hypothetical protein [Actinopolymorpha cephalotaxi]NYH81523.1 hypothetical protein [Actinopolymorpha cephalotaxi]SFF84843.1 hypothetical protein SAMN05421678_102386 [Actinopolymorpha cephalotaxi]